MTTPRSMDGSHLLLCPHQIDVAGVLGLRDDSHENYDGGDGDGDENEDEGGDGRRSRQDEEEEENEDEDDAVVQVSAGWGCTGLVTRQGKVFLCGRNEEGQLGNDKGGIRGEDDGGVASNEKGAKGQMDGDHFSINERGHCIQPVFRRVQALANKRGECLRFSTSFCSCLAALYKP